MQHTLMTKNQEYIKNADKSVRKDKYNIKIGNKPEQTFHRRRNIRPINTQTGVQSP